MCRAILEPKQSGISRNDVNEVKQYLPVEKSLTELKITPRRIEGRLKCTGLDLK